MLTRPCNLEPFKFHFYIVKLGVYSIHYFSYFWSKVDCWYVLETPKKVCSKDSVFWAKNKESITIFNLKSVNIKGVKIAVYYIKVNLIFFTAVPFLTNISHVLS